MTSRLIHAHAVSICVLHFVDVEMKKNDIEIFYCLIELFNLLYSIKIKIL